MRFKITLDKYKGDLIPINYSYPLSSALYRVIAKGDAEYAHFLHEAGYGKGFKFFTFSQIDCPFKIEKDRLRLLNNQLSFQVGFHLPEATTNFIKGLFQSEQIEIADKQSQVIFKVKSIESLPNSLQKFNEGEIIQVLLNPISPMVSGHYNDRRMYDYLSPDDHRFSENLIYNWRSKIKTCYDETTSQQAILMIEVIPMKMPFKSRLITVKSESNEETKVRGWMNFHLKVTAEKRFIDLLLNGGVGLQNSIGFGCVDVVEE